MKRCEIPRALKLPVNRKHVSQSFDKTITNADQDLLQYERVLLSKLTQHRIYLIPKYLFANDQG